MQEVLEMEAVLSSTKEQPKEQPNANPGKTWTNDLLASIVVFLVALPLSMGVAVASGVSPAKGLITGIIGGILVGALAGCPLQVSGPAAGLTVLIWQIVQTHGVASLGIIVLLAGVFQVVAAMFKLGQWFRASSPSVIHGMLAGIGVLIIGSQLHVMMDDKPKGSGLKNLAYIPQAFWNAIDTADGSTHHLAATIGILTIGIMVAWSFVPKTIKVIPAPLVAVTVSAIVANLFDLPIKYINVPANLLNEVEFPTLGALQDLLDGKIIVSALAIAIIASAETLLTATAVDQMQQGPRTNYDRELLAQGIGNSLCGLLGAIPMTGVIVRSSANVEAGAKTRLSAILHGGWILASVVLLPFVLSKIPTTALAAILVFTGFKLVFSKARKELMQYGLSEVRIYYATIVAIVATDLLTGVIIGLVLSMLKLLYVFSHLEINIFRAKSGKEITISLVGAATFIRLPLIAAKLEALPPDAEVHVRLDELAYVDHACLELLSNWRSQYERNGGKAIVEIDRLHQRYQEGRPSQLDPSEDLSTREMSAIK
jgi:MFS superfamily sulfate permease-like transporter